MPSAFRSDDRVIAAKLRAVGKRVRARRKELKLSAVVTAESAGLSRMTLHRIEHGEPSVTIGAYMSVTAAIGLDLQLVDGEQKERTKTKLPRVISLSEYPELRRLAWQLGDTATLTPQEALSLYERNWRHVDRARLEPKERTLIRLLAVTLGASLVV